jgi:NTP pyrophosphatase (non-canonical NTP hydrolase)
MNLDQLAKTLHQTATEKGFWDFIYNNQHAGHEFIFFSKQLAMVHSEVTEVLEALRKDKGQQAVVEELADIIIRVLDLYAGLQANGFVSASLDEVLSQKANFNSTRPRMHGVAG